MNDIENKLIQGNLRFAGKIEANPEYFNLRRQQVSGQKPYALIITCSDSRVVPEEIFSTYLGELFVIRSAGNVINEGELASVEYGLEHLHIEYCLVLAHTHCGAVHAAIHKEKGKYLSPILDNIENSIAGECDEYLASKKNALAQVKYLREKFPDFKGIIKVGIYNIETSLVEIIGE